MMRNNNNNKRGCASLSFLLVVIILGSFSCWRGVADAFVIQQRQQQQPPPLGVSLYSTRRKRTSTTTRLHVSSTTPPPPSQRQGFFNNNTLSGFSIFQNDNADKSLLSKNAGKEEENTFVTSTIMPILSSALLITSSTFGAGSLVLPELAQGPGLAPTFLLFLGAYSINLISGLCIAQVAIQQKNNKQLDYSMILSANDDSELEQHQIIKNNDVPCSFKEFVESTTGSHALATFISTISFGVNSLVWAFGLSRVGILASQVTHMSSNIASTTWAALLVILFATQSPGRISQSTSVSITTVLFASFASLLIPGLAAVPHDFITVLSQPGLAENPMSSMTTLAPVVYMSTIYQNMVPTVAKLQDYHPTRTMSAIVLGSLIPLVMYLSWCYACLGGGIDLDALTTSGGDGGNLAGPLLTVFSLATLAGSSIGCGMSIASEINPFVKATLNLDNKNNKNQENENDRFSLPTVLVSVGLPLAICHVFGRGGDLTGALSVAGGLGSPLLYGIIPVVMAWKQSQQQQESAAIHNQSVEWMPPFLRQHNKASIDYFKQTTTVSPTTTTSFVPASSLGVLGVVSTGMLGNEIVGQVSRALAAVTSTTTTAPVAAVEGVGEMVMAMVPL